LDRVPFLASAWAEEPRKRKATHGFVMGQWALFFGFGICEHIRCCGNGFLGFRPYGGSLFPNAEKVTKKAGPQRTALR